jgi:hypothetical protein
MAITIDWPTKVISVPQADLTFISGTLYEMDTDWFRLQLKAIEASEEGMPFDDTHIHNTEVTVAGTTFFRTVEIINGYSVQFTPDAQWTVRLAGSNNNIFDVENGILAQNQVQVISTNSAGGQVVTTDASGLTSEESTQLDTINTTTVLLRKLMQNRMETDPDTGVLTIYDDDDITPYLRGNIYEDVLAATLYRGRGIERRNKLNVTTAGFDSGFDEGFG